MRDSQIKRSSYNLNGFDFPGLNATKIQSGIRGYKSRQWAKRVRFSTPMLNLISSSFNKATHGFDNPLVKAVEENIGPIEIKPLNDGHPVSKKESVELDEGNRYLGEWSDATGK